MRQWLTLVISSVMHLAVSGSGLARAECDCSGCGTFIGETCTWINNSFQVETGYYYDEKGTCEELCCEGESPDECSTGVTSIELNRYSLSGGLEASKFSLEGGWEEEKTTTSTCNIKITCSGDGDCDGPSFAYVRWSYEQRGIRRRNHDRGCDCDPCVDNLRLGLLKKIL